MHMTLEADYAVRIVEFLAAANQKVDARTISEETHVPLRFALKILRKLVADAKASGTGKSYLIQHSAGSGKSNSIAWLAHHLQSLHDANDSPVFDTVVILTDRRNLDAQLSETIDAVEHKRGVVVRIREEDGSAGLREALNSGAQIITSTIQKFPYICSETKVSGRKFAVIIDEAHSSQSGKANAKMKLALIDRDLDPDEPWDDEDELAKEMKAQGTIPNLSFFAFTATPKAAPLEVFGTRDELCKRDESGILIPRPFHLYSMKQAIDEGFILDVLENYTCFESYFKLVKTIADDPKYKEMKANRALMGIVDWNPAMIGSKAQIIVEHFMNDVEGVLDHHSKAMVVTWSRPMAYRLYLAMAEYIKQQKYACQIMVAFSGRLDVDGEEVTEAKVNGVAETRTAELFDTDEKRIIVCANKFQTGFDQPKLCAMYVDKMLTGVAAVQTLSRLNRTCSIPGKRTFVVDFANDWETIRASFSDYYEATQLDAATDPDVIYNLQERLDGYHVYDATEIEAVASVYFDEPDPGAVLRKIEPKLQPAVDRWQALDDTPKREFKALLRKFLFKPVQDVLDKRQKMVDDELANAQDAKTKAEAALAAANDKLHNVDVEAAARREESAQQAEKQKDQLLAEAQRQADAIVAEGKAAAEAERASKLRQADAQIADLTRTMCAKVLERNLTQQDDARMLDDLLQKAGESDGKRV